LIKTNKTTYNNSISKINKTAPKPPPNPKLQKHPKTKLPITQDKN
jgi:hypothetical protein